MFYILQLSPFREVFNYEDQLAMEGRVLVGDVRVDLLPRIGAVRMRRCHACARIVPPNNLASYKLVRLCDDCRIQPDVHPDEIDQKPTCARAPGAHLRQWIEGVTYEKPHLGNPRKRLMQIGLTDSEITAMALVFAGYSTRRVGNIGHWSQAYVRKLFKFATNKLQRSGLPVPKAPPAGRQRHRPFAPITIQKLADGTD